jgi:hypothetical protein
VVESDVPIAVRLRPHQDLPVLLISTILFAREEFMRRES